MLLNKAGYRTRNGSKFTFTTINRLLRDPSAKGIRRANYTKSLGEGKHWKLKPKDDWIEIPIQPIVDVDTWEQVNAILEARDRTWKKPARRAVQLFAGIAYCDCGQKMRVPSNNRKYICSTCQNKISIDDLEEIFHLQLKNFLFSPNDISDYLSAADELIETRTNLLESLTKERTKIQAEMAKVYKLYIEDRISSEGFGNSYKPLEERLAQVEAQLPELQGEVDFLKIQYISSNETVSEFQSLYDRWTTLDQSEKRTVVEHSVERISIGADEIRIELGYLPS